MENLKTKFNAESTQAMINEAYNLHNSSVEKSTKKTTSFKTDLKKYFNPSGLLEKGQQTGEVRVRILPPNDGGTSPFLMKKFHNMNIEGQWRKLYDPGQDGLPSPLNVKGKSLYEMDSKEDRREAAKYIANDFFICRIIQRGAEDHGPKFYRFRVSTDGTDFFSLLKPWLQRGKNPFDPTSAGCDVTLTLTRVTKNNKSYVKVSNVICEDPSPLHTDDVQAIQWIEDEMTWKNVYKVYPTDYLHIIALGGVPAWDKENKCYIDKEQLKDVLNSSSSTSMGGGSTAAPADNNTVTPETQAQTEAPSQPESQPEPTNVIGSEYTKEISDDDLPF